jgi:hypothetical protein
MPAVIPFIPLIVGGITAGTTAYAANAQGNAQDKASRTQQQMARESLDAQEKAANAAMLAEQAALDKSLKFQTDQRDYDRDAQRLAREDYIQRTSPYVTMGNNAFGRLSELLGTGKGQPFQPPMSAPQAGPAQAPPQARQPLMSAQAPVGMMPGGGGSLANLGTPQTEGTAAIGQGSPSQNAMGVRMLAPTGEVGIVPYDKVGQAIAAGARRLN